MTTSDTFAREQRRRPDAELIDAIRAIKSRMGGSLVILGHHYQSDAIVDLSDFVGDSFKLARDAAHAQGEYIVFCGVRFMAESARVLARAEQVVQHPEGSAGCPMADMADLDQVQEAWDILTRMQGAVGRKIVPVTYMNSSVEIKAFCGRKGGAVCTSSNAGRVLEWAYSGGNTVLFLPDEHLGRNTANSRGIPRDRIRIWNPVHAKKHANDDSFARADIIVWSGFCHVHTRFTVDDVERVRREHPGVQVMVHPECTEEVVSRADSAGSTEAIIRRVVESKPGDTICIGTEINLVQRLAKRFPDRTVLPLALSHCPNMARITLENLLLTLENPGTAGVVEVEPETSAQARRALEKMLEIG